jgi:two-component system nitrogen regulation sensor histidine kinase NtrY
VDEDSQAVTLRARLFALVSALVFAVVVLTTWTVSVSARRAFEALDAQRTAALIAECRREFARQSDDVAARVERMASSDVLRRAAIDLGSARVDRAALVNEATPLAAAHGLDFLDIVAADGTIVSSAHWPARFGYPHPWAARAPKTEGSAFLDSVELPRETALALVAVRAVTAAGERRLIVAGGRRVDRQFLESFALPEGMRVMLYRNVEPEVAGQQLVDAHGQVAEAAALDPLIARVRQQAQERVETIQRPDGPETIDAIPLTGREGTVLGVLLVGSSGRALASLVNRIRWSGAAFGAVGLVLGFALSYLVAARVTRPVEQLADAAREISAGRWDVRVDDITAPGEIGDLARAFDGMTAALVNQRERLVQAERVSAWRELARRLAHELKNPLFPLRITLDNLRRSRSLPAIEFQEVFDEGLAAFSSGLGSLNTVVAQFADFAKMPTPNFAHISPNQVVRETLTLFRAQLDEPGRPAMTVSVDLDPAAGTIRADADQLKRALQNLLLNAFDAMPSGGEVGVRTKRLGNRLHIDVTDTGTGLTDEECRRLFTPYYTTKQHGTGLGLAIVQSVVADHAGRIWVESRPGRGTTFHIELPDD